MPPTTQPKIGDVRSRQGGQTTFVTSRNMNRPVRSETPLSTAIETPLNINVPDTIPSDIIGSGSGLSDVMNRRREIEQTQQLTGQYDTLMGRIGNVQGTPLSNPNEYINRLLLNRPTETQTALDTARTDQASRIRGFADDFQEAGAQARTELGIPALQANLAETRNRIAERTTQLRKTLRDFEVNATRTGFAREFVEAEKRGVQAEAAAELADLAIIESAQLGNVQAANDEVDRILAEKMQGFEFENQAIQAEIQRLEAMDTREADRRKEQLTIALQERTRNIETQLANEKEARGYLIEAAQNGADNGTLDAIRKAQTPAEAAFIAGPWIGRLDRQAKLASIRASNLSAQKSALEIEALRGTETGDSNIAVQALDSFSGALNQNNREQFTRAVTNGVKRANPEQVEIALKNAAQAAGGAALREDVIKRDQAINALRDVKNALSEYEQAGGSTNLLTGGYEDLQNKLGQTSDPALASIETRINLALNAYTNAVSGASFTPQESARYEALFPSTSNTSVLNTTKVDTLIDSFEANNQSFYGNFLGGYTPSQLAEEAVYQELRAKATPEQLKEAGITQ